MLSTFFSTQQILGKCPKMSANESNADVIEDLLRSPERNFARLLFGKLECVDRILSRVVFRKPATWCN